MRKYILVVVTNQRVRQAVRAVIEGEPNFFVCGEAGDGQKAIQKAKHLQPDLVVLDLTMPVMNGVAAARVLSNIMPHVPLILLTIHDRKWVESEVRSAGISVVLPKVEVGFNLIPHARALLGPGSNPS